MKFLSKTKAQLRDYRMQGGICNEVIFQIYASRQMSDFTYAQWLLWGMDSEVYEGSNGNRDTFTTAVCLE
jgi:hypothetical protein